MGDAQILNLKALAHASDGTVIPAATRAKIADLDRVLDAANSVFEEAQIDAEALRAEARELGYTQGISDARDETARELVALHRRGHELFEKQTAVVQEMALAIVERLAPELDAGSLVQPMVTRAILAAQASQYLQVRVHPSQVGVAKAAIDELGNVHPAVATYQVIADELIDERACVVETEVGAVRSSLSQQIAAMRTALSAPHDDDDADQ